MFCRFCWPRLRTPLATIRCKFFGLCHRDDLSPIFFGPRDNLSILLAPIVRAPRDDSSPILLAAPCDDPPPILWLPHRKPLAAIHCRFVRLCHRASLVRCHFFGQCTSPLLHAIAIFCILFQAQACAALAPSHPSIAPTGDRNSSLRRRASSHQDSSRRRAIINNNRADGRSLIIFVRTGDHKQSSRRRAIIDIHGADGRPLHPRRRAPSTSRILPISPFSAWAIQALCCTLPFAFTMTI